MNLISYRGMPLMVLYSNPCVREVVLDESGTTYLWTKWILSVVVTYNPQAVSFVQLNQQNGNVPPFAGGVVGASAQNQMPGNTDRDIRRFLEYPRGQLIVWSTDDPPGLNQQPDPTGQGQRAPRQTDVRQAFANPRNPNPNQVQGVMVLRSPSNDANGNPRPCDANNGPFCKVNSIQEIAGERLWQMHLTFETCVYEDSLATTDGTPPVIVSNRWSMASDTNWQHLTTRIIEGIVHVRMDQLIARGVAAGNALEGQIDALRSTFAAFGVPKGFQRESVQVRVLPQGNMCAYRIVDAEQLLQKDSTTRPVRIEVREASWMQKGSFGRAIAQSITAGAFAAPGLGEILGGPMAIFNRMQTIGNRLIAQLPSRYKTVIVKVWGNRLTKRVAMTTLAVAVARNRMGTQFLIDTTTAETIVQYDSGSNMVEVQTTSRWNFNDFGSLVVNGFNVIPNLFDPVATGLGDIGLGRFIGQDANMGPINQTDNFSEQPRFPNDNQTRGTWGPPFANAPLDYLVTQVLETIGQPPADPPGSR